MRACGRARCSTVSRNARAAHRCIARHTGYEPRKLHPAESAIERNIKSARVPRQNAEERKREKERERRWKERKGERAHDTGSAARHSANFQPPPTRPPPIPSRLILRPSPPPPPPFPSSSRIRQPPTLPLFELVFAASTARSMGLLTRVGIYVRVPTAPGQFSPSLPRPPSPTSCTLLPFREPTQPLDRALLSLPSQCLFATLYRVIIKSYAVDADGPMNELFLGLRGVKNKWIIE